MGRLIRKEETPLTTSVKKAKDMTKKPKNDKIALVEVKSSEIVNPATIDDKKKKKLFSLHLVRLDRNRDVESAMSGKQDAYAKKILADISMEHNTEHDLTKAESMHYAFQGASVDLFHDGIGRFQSEIARRAVLALKFCKVKTIGEAHVLCALRTDIHGGEKLAEGGLEALEKYNAMYPPKERAMKKAPTPLLIPRKKRVGFPGRKAVVGAPKTAVKAGKALKAK